MEIDTEEFVKNRNYDGYKFAFMSGTFLTIAHFIAKVETHDFHPIHITAVNAVICSLLIVAYLVITKSGFSICHEERLYVGIHALGHTGANLLYFYSLSLIPAYDATVIGSLAPIIGGLLAWAFLGEKLTLFDILLVIIVTIGLVLVCQPTFIFSSTSADVSSISSGNRLKGTLSAFFSSFSWAITCCSNRRIQKTGVLPMELAVYAVILMTSTSVIFAANLQFNKPFEYRYLVLFVISFAFLIGHAVNCRALQLEEVCRIGVIKNIENVFMLIFQWIFLGELPTVIGFIGSVIVLVGVIIFILKEQIYNHYFKT